MLKICSYNFSILITSLFLLLLLGSCNFGPQPDKIIEITIELNDGDTSIQKINSVVDVLKKRLQKITDKAEVVHIQDGNRIKIKVATYYEAERFKNYILNPGKLDFYETYGLKDFTTFLVKVNEEAKREEESEVDPFFDLIKNAGYQGGPVLFYVEEKDTAQIKTYISSKTAELALLDKKRFVKFLWGVKEEETGNFPLYALKKNRLGKPALSGDVVIDAFMNYNTLNMPVISMQMNEEGAERWRDLTGKAYAQRSQIAIVLNNEVYSAPGVSSGPIVGGKSEISGDFTIEEAQDFANILVSGSIPGMKLLSFEVKKIE
ncbi:SecDF P1 head subdomain-containing protein [Aquimarina sp. 2201CG14-23]|uniref:SecDF P1 head subdomain-containing protein n=1 Tax=Aquimarina mycalae TaxID=3040073 RepID=UPI002477E6E2|nr:hypothetical protein [Aquimarina sp. 2201CG14-23]MDH7445005.1 hypothetical protein [Aquimarina sp. 2201CG14-23]